MRRSEISAGLFGAVLVLLALLTAVPDAFAAECPGPSSSIATDRPDVTNSSLVVPFGSLQIENGINTTGRDSEKTFDGTNSRLRLGIASCLEILVDLPNYVGALQGSPATGFGNVIPAIKWQVSALPEDWSLSVTAGAGLPTGAAQIAGTGVQPYIQFPWSHEFNDDWGMSGMFTSFFSPADPSNQQTFEVTFSVERKISERTGVFVEYVGDYPSTGNATNMINMGGEYLVTPTQQFDFHIAFGLGGDAPTYIIGIGYSFRFDGLFRLAGK